MKVGLIGATGFIGSALAKQLAKSGHEVVGFSRRSDVHVLGVSQFRRITDGNADFSGLDALVNLAGYPVNCRWTQKRKQLIRSSRVDLTRALVKQLAALSPQERPRRLVVGTAIGIYGERGDEELDEKSALGIDDFLGEVVRDWELAAGEAELIGIPTTCVRTGMVLGAGGEAWEKMRRVFSLGIGGRLGSGQQWMSWIHVDDLARLFCWALEHPESSSILNGTAPEPVKNQEFTRLLGRALRRPTFFAVPGWALRLVFGSFGGWLLKSSCVLPSASLEAGFEFEFETLESALADLNCS